MGLAKKKYQVPPRTGMEAFMMLPEGTSAELINDVIYIFPSPDYIHQSILCEVACQIYSYTKENRIGSCVMRRNRRSSVLMSLVTKMY